MKIAMLSGADARRRLDDAGWLAAWRGLAAADGKLTLLQEPEFVLPWYEAYREVYEPLLVEARATDGELMGLMPLALRDSRLAHAGAGQAEYHGWIARPEQDQDFPLQAVLALGKEYPLDGWAWRWLPPGAGSGWCDAPEIARAGLHIVTEACKAPLWDLGEGEKLAKLDSSRSLRSKANRYRRRGEYRLERISDQARLGELLPLLAAQCDFRQEVVHGVRPFADDPYKADFFFRRLGNPESNHFTVLWCGDEPLSFQFGACDGRVCLLGLSAYAPSESKNSPGTLHIVELARKLVEEGCQSFDLTPGYDPYKQRFANAEQDLRRLTVSRSLASRWRGELRKGLRSSLLAVANAGNQGMRERSKRWQRSLQAVKRDLHGKGLRGLLFGPGGRLLGPSSLQCLALDASAPRPAGMVQAVETEEVRLQAWQDLLLSTAGEPFSTRRDLLSDALSRFSAGQVLYSLREADRLSVFAWRAEASNYGEAAERHSSKAQPEKGDTLLQVFPDEGAETPERKATALRACLLRMLADCEAAEGKRILLCATRLDRSATGVAAELGFRRI